MAPKKGTRAATAAARAKRTSQLPEEDPQLDINEDIEDRRIGNMNPDEAVLNNVDEEEDIPLAQRVQNSLEEQQHELERIERCHKIDLNRRRRVAREQRAAETARSNHQFAPEIDEEETLEDAVNLQTSQHPLVYEMDALAVYGGPRELNILPTEVFSERPFSLLSGREQLNAKIHSNIFNAVNNLPFFVTNSARDRAPFIDVHRLHYSSDPENTEAVYTHNHGDQRRTVLHIRISRHEDFLTGASTKQKLDILNTLARQQEFFTREDCCQVQEAIRLARDALTSAVAALSAGLVDNEMKREFRAHLDEWECLSREQQSILCSDQVWLMANSIPTSRIDIERQNEEQIRLVNHSLRSEITRLEQQIAQRDKRIADQEQQRFDNNLDPIGFQDNENNLLDMSMQGSHNTHILLKSEPLPHWDDFQPGTEDCKRLLTFVRKAINQRQDLQRSRWPRKLCHNIDSFWRLTRVNAMSADIKLSQAPEDWTDLTGEMMLAWLEFLMDKSKRNHQETPQTEFMSYLIGTKFEINWGEFDAHQNNTFIVKTVEVEFKWNHVLENVPESQANSEDFHKPFIKQFLKNLSHHGGSLGFKNDMSALIHNAVQDKKKFGQMIHTIQAIVREQLDRLSLSAKFFYQSSNKKPKSNTWRWDDDNKSFFQSKAQREVITVQRLQQLFILQAGETQG